MLLAKKQTLPKCCNFSRNAKTIRSTNNFLAILSKHARFNPILIKCQLPRVNLFRCQTYELTLRVKSTHSLGKTKTNNHHGAYLFYQHDHKIPRITMISLQGWPKKRNRNLDQSTIGRNLGSGPVWWWRWRWRRWRRCRRHSGSGWEACFDFDGSRNSWTESLSYHRKIKIDYVPEINYLKVSEKSTQWLKTSLCFSLLLLQKARKSERKPNRTATATDRWTLLCCRHSTMQLTDKTTPHPWKNAWREIESEKVSLCQWQRVKQAKQMSRHHLLQSFEKGSVRISHLMRSLSFLPSLC